VKRRRDFQTEIKTFEPSGPEARYKRSNKGREIPKQRKQRVLVGKGKPDAGQIRTALGYLEEEGPSRKGGPRGVNGKKTVESIRGGSTLKRS